MSTSTTDVHDDVPHGSSTRDATGTVESLPRLPGLFLVCARPGEPTSVLALAPPPTLAEDSVVLAAVRHAVRERDDYPVAFADEWCAAPGSAPLWTRPLAAPPARSVWTETHVAFFYDGPERDALLARRAVFVRWERTEGAADYYAAYTRDEWSRRAPGLHYRRNPSGYAEILEAVLPSGGAEFRTLYVELFATGACQVFWGALRVVRYDEFSLQGSFAIAYAVATGTPLRFDAGKDRVVEVGLAEARAVFLSGKGPSLSAVVPLHVVADDPLSRLVTCPALPHVAACLVVDGKSARDAFRNVLLRALVPAAVDVAREAERVFGRPVEYADDAKTGAVALRVLRPNTSEVVLTLVTSHQWHTLSLYEALRALPSATEATPSLGPLLGPLAASGAEASPLFAPTGAWSVWASVPATPPAAAPPGV